MKRIAAFIVGLLISSAALAQPVTTKPNISNTVAQCLLNVPMVGNGAAASPICHASGALTALAFSTTGTGVSAALGVNVGTAGAFVVNGGALGTPSSGTATNLTGLPISTGVIGLGTGIATALAVNTGSAGAPVLFNGALGSPSSAGTLPAHTLGGTIAGGGNQINNVIIGASTPLAGSFTTLSASTSGVFGNTTSPDTTLTVNNNNGAPDAPTFGTNALHLVSADATLSGVYLDNYGTPGTHQGYIAARMAGGTRASKTATAGPNGIVFSFFGQAYDGSVYSTFAAIDFQTNVTQSGSDHSGNIAFRTVAPATTSLTAKIILQASGSLNVGATGTDFGFGNISATGGIASAISTTKTTNYSMTVADSSLIFNGAGSLTLTLLSAASYPGRWLTIKTVAAQTVVSASSNVVAITGGAAATAILAATAGKWAKLQSDGTNWVVMMAN